MILNHLLKKINCKIIGDDSIDITGLCYDSRNISKGDVFFCIKGYETDGHKYVQSAIDNGASAIVTDHFIENADAVQIIVNDTREAMAEIAASYFDFPALKMKMIGITGTNGKTTTTYLIKKIAESAGYKVGLIGTICNMIGEKEYHTERTTPESLDLQKLLYEMSEEGCDLVVMEVSSHSLYLKRVFGIEFNIGILSNITQDHLDFHKTMDAYVDAKSILFSQSETSLLNADDLHLSNMENAAKNLKYTYGIYNEADFKAENLNFMPNGVKYNLVYQDHILNISVPIPGIFSVYNSLAAAAASIILNITPKIIQRSLSNIEQVAGRFELLDTKDRDYSIILDYAHTPDSLENVLKTIQGFAPARIITVFGCGGNRDSAKRPIMGNIAEKYSDFVIVTSDNPRFEDPIVIINNIEAGMENDNHICIENREAAIAYALSFARKDDIILLAGKGHETYQEIKGIKNDFDEKIIVAKLLSETE